MILLIQETQGNSQNRIQYSSSDSVGSRQYKNITITEFRIRKNSEPKQISNKRSNSNTKPELILNG